MKLNTFRTAAVVAGLIVTGCGATYGADEGAVVGTLAAPESPQAAADCPEPVSRELAAALPPGHGAPRDDIATVLTGQLRAGGCPEAVLFTRTTSHPTESCCGEQWIDYANFFVFEDGWHFAGALEFPAENDGGTFEYSPGIKAASLEVITGEQELLRLLSDEGQGGHDPRHVLTRLTYATLGATGPTPVFGCVVFHQRVWGPCRLGESVERSTNLDGSRLTVESSSSRDQPVGGDGEECGHNTIPGASLTARYEWTGAQFVPIGEDVCAVEPAFTPIR